MVEHIGLLKDVKILVLEIHNLSVSDIDSPEGI